MLFKKQASTKYHYIYALNLDATLLFDVAMRICICMDACASISPENYFFSVSNGILSTQE